MAKLKIEEVDDNTTATQTVSMPGFIRNVLVKEASRNGRSLSSEIIYRATQTLIQEGKVSI